MSRDELFEIVMGANDWNDGGLVLPNNGHKIVDAVFPIIEALEEALCRIVEATPSNTNSATAARMASWTKAVAATALAGEEMP